MYTQKELVIMNEKDNVGVIKEFQREGETIVVEDGKSKNVISVKEDIPFGFKIALKNIKQNDKIYKYGETIGIAGIDIKKGEMVHIHNVEGVRGRGDLNSPE